LADDSVAQFETLILPHLDAAYTFARYLLRDEHEAQDAVQEAALRAFRAFPDFRGGDARAWFLVIVRNLCLSWRRKHRANPVVATGHDDPRAAGVEPRAADADAIASSDRAAIRHAVLQLPVEFREAIVLRELQELSYTEISAVLAIPIGTVMSRLSRARRMLAQSLGHVIREVG
jgi:RNA polymerase sigma-70 factor (ECF subfamily)